MKTEKIIRHSSESLLQVKKLKRSYVLLNSLQVFAVIVVVGFLILSYYKLIKSNQLRSSGDRIMKYSYVEGDDTVTREELNKIRSIEIPYVIYRVVDGEREMLFSSIEKTSDEVIEKAYLEADAAEKNEGLLSEYGLVFLKQEAGRNREKRIALGEYSYVHAKIMRFAVIELCYVAAVMAMMFGISIIMARLMTKPLSEMLKKQESFIMDASHELKTPITVILANNGIIQSHADDTVKNQMQWVNSTDEEARHMKKIIENLLALMKADSNAFEYDRETVDFGRVVQQVCLNYDTVAFERNIDLSFFAESDVYILGDKSALKQMATILVDNAVKYEPDGGSVRVSIEKAGNKAVLRVRNKKSSINEKDIEHIFDRFFRSGEARSVEGTGLGLSIAKQITDAHDGVIDVISNKGEGCELRVTLPKLKTDPNGMII